VQERYAWGVFYGVLTRKFIAAIRMRIDYYLCISLSLSLSLSLSFSSARSLARALSLYDTHTHTCKCTFMYINTHIHMCLLCIRVGVGAGVPSCKSQVFGSKSECFKCRTPKPSAAAAPDAKREGDWHCSSCNALVFASKSECFKCRTPKGVSDMDDFIKGYQLFAGPLDDTRDGDWHCSSCNALVFASKNECYKCHTPKGTADVDDFVKGYQLLSAAPNDAKRGSTGRSDWTCQKCDAVVFGKKSECFQCGESKKTAAPKVQVALAPDAPAPGVACGIGSDYQSKARGGGGAGGGGRLTHAELNMELLGAEGEQLCKVVKERWRDFNAVNAATAYQLLLTTMSARSAGQQGGGGRRRQSAHEEALTILEPVLCNQHVQAFSARECANTLHTLAKLQGRRPCGDVICALEARALEVREDFNPQNTGNMLWAFAMLGRQPGNELVVGLTQRVLQFDLKPQDIAITLWALATLGTFFGPDSQ